MDEMREHLKQLENDGYINGNGNPLKCQTCEHKDFTMVEDYYCPMGLEEYKLKCDNCGAIVGHWAFGYWQV